MKANSTVDIHTLLQKNERVIINLGCGARKKEGQIGIDQADLPGVDIVADLEEGLKCFPAASVDQIHCRNVLEHIANLEPLLKEMLRVLKENGRAYISVPHFSNPYFYSDPTHIRFFGLYTFYYYVDPKHQLRRKVPVHYSDLRLHILSQRYVFRSSFGLLGFLKKAVGRLINCSSLLQEYYEENLCRLMPACGIEIVIGHPSLAVSYPDPKRSAGVG